jgi:hypothetical protein
MSGVAFGQQKQRGQVQQTTTKKLGSSSVMPIKKEAEMKVQGIEPVIIEERREDPRPVSPPPPPIVDPPAPWDTRGATPSTPPGGGTSTPPPEELKTCVVSCSCTDIAGPEITNQTEGGCTDKVYFMYSATLTKHFEVKSADCGTVDKSSVCKGNVGYTGYSVSLSSTKYSGCGQPPITTQQYSNSDAGLPPANVGPVRLATSCNGGY